MLEQTLDTLEARARGYLDRLPSIARNYLRTELASVEQALGRAIALRPYQATSAWHEQYQREVVTPMVNAGVQAVNRIYDLYERVTSLPVVGGIFDMVARAYLLFRYGSGHIPKRSTVIRAVQGMGELAENELRENAQDPYQPHALWSYLTNGITALRGYFSGRGEASSSTGGKTGAVPGRAGQALRELVQILTDLFGEGTSQGPAPESAG